MRALEPTLQDLPLCLFPPHQSTFLGPPRTLPPRWHHDWAPSLSMWYLVPPLPLIQAWWSCQPAPHSYGLCVPGSVYPPGWVLERHGVQAQCIQADAGPDSKWCSVCREREASRENA